MRAATHAPRIHCPVLTVCILNNKKIRKPRPPPIPRASLSNTHTHIYKHIYERDAQEKKKTRRKRRRRQFGPTLRTYRVERLPHFSNGGCREGWRVLLLIHAVHEVGCAPRTRAILLLTNLGPLLLARRLFAPSTTFGRSSSSSSTFTCIVGTVAAL